MAKRHRDKRYPVGNPLRKYYLPGLYAKFAGVIFIAFVYQYYYQGGDTFNYFRQSRVINSSLDESFSTWIDLLLRRSPDANPHIYAYSSQMEWYEDPASYSVAVIGALLGLLNGTTYLPIALLFAYISYTGIWAMYKTFSRLYPTIYKQLAIAFLFIPSTIVWGSAIFKDTICMFGLGWMTYCTFRIFLNKDFSMRNIFMLALSFYLVAVIKLYILLAFIPALSLWLLMTYSKKIKIAGLRFLVNIVFLGIVVGAFFFVTSRFSKELDKYSLENVSKTADLTRDWITYASGDEGSAYNIGEFDGSIGSTLTKFPAGVVVTLFRPFPWEVKKVIVALSALEALLFLYFTLKIFFNRRTKFRRLLKDPTILFCLSFSLIFAFSVGVTTGNFGALSRYKIPCLPFYGAFLVIGLNYAKTLSSAASIQLKSPRNTPVLA
jgi:hypothetical protein